MGMMGFDGVFSGFGAAFGVFGVLFSIAFLLVVGVFAVILVKNISQWNKNNHAPRLTVSATVVAKRTNVYSHDHARGNGMHHTGHTTTYYVTFQVESGDRMELQLAG